MITARFLVALVLLGLFASCGQQRNAVVGEGLFQKRKYLPGWHVDLGRRTAVQPTDRTVRTPPLLPRTEVLSTARSLSTEEDHSELSEAFPSSEAMALVATAAPATPAQRMVQHTPAQETATLAPQDRNPDNIMPRKRFNVLAIPALLFVLAGIVLAFVSNSGWLVVGALAIGLVLAAISLRRIRSREQSGKAFALTALILGVMAAVITAMVIVRTGF